MYIFNKAEMLGNGTIQLREKEVVILQDGTEYETGKFHRKVFTPDMDINTIDCERCKAAATLFWTPEVVSAYNTSIPQE